MRDQIEKLLSPLDWKFFRGENLLWLWDKYPLLFALVALGTFLLGFFLAWMAAGKLRRKHRECMDEFERLGRELKQTDDRTAELRKHMVDSKAKRELETVRADLESNLAQREKAVRSLNDQISALQLNLDESDKMVSSFKTREEEGRSELEETRLTLASREAESEELRVGLEEVRSELGSREAELSGLQSRLDELEDQREASDRTIDDLRVRAETAEREGAEKEEAAGASAGRLDELESLLSQRASEVNDLRLRLNAASKGSEKADAGRNEEFDRLRAKIGQLEAELSTSRQESTRTAEAGDADTEALRSRIADLEDAEQDWKNRITAAEEAAAKAETKSQDFASAQQGGIDDLARLRIGDLERELGENGQTIAQYRDEVDDLRIQLAERDVHLKSKNEEVQSLGLQATEMKKTGGNLNSELQQLRVQLEEAQGAAGTAREDARTEMDEAVGTLEVQLQDTRAVLSEKEKALADYEIRLGRSDEMRETLEGELASLRQALTSREREIDDAQNRFLKIEGSVDDYQVRIDQLEAELASREEKLGSLEKEHSDLVVTYRSKQEDFSSLKELLTNQKVLLSQQREDQASAMSLRAQVQGLNRKIATRDRSILKLKETAKTTKVTTKKTSKAKPKAKTTTKATTRKTATQKTKTAAKARKTKTTKAATSKATSRRKPTKKKTTARKTATTKRTPVKKKATTKRRATTSKPSDDLTRIRGVGPKLSARLKRMGYRTFDDVASMTLTDIAKVEQTLDFHGRISRDQWIAQARALARGETPTPPKRTTTSKSFIGSAPATSEPSPTRDAKLGLVYKTRPDSVDDLKRISGVATVLEGKLHKFGVYRFKQISEWNRAQIEEFSERLSFPDRIDRDNWVAQARKLHEEKYGK